MRNDAATVGCAVLILVCANLAFYGLIVAAICYIAKAILFS